MTGSNEQAEILEHLRRGGQAWNEFRASKPGGFRTTVSDTDLSTVDFADANLSFMWFNSVDFQRADLREVSFLACRFAGVRLDGCDLRGLDFSDTWFDRVDVRWANLSGCNFEDLSIRNVTFEGSDLSGANFAGARLTNIDFTDADLRDANFQGATHSADTTWPMGFEPQATALSSSEMGAPLSDEQLERLLQRNQRRNDTYRSSVFDGAKELPFRLNAELPSGKRQSYSIGPDDQLLMATWLTGAESETHNVELTLVSDGGSGKRTLNNQPRNRFQYIAAGGEKILVRDSSAGWEGTSPVPNFFLWDAGGEVIQSFAVGNGGAQISANGVVFSHYSDESIYNRNGAPEGSTPVEAFGLNRYNKNGELDWQFQPPQGLDHISDCYALNVVGETGWFCYYPDFAICRLSGDELSWWPSEVAGIHSLAVSDRHIALIGGHAAPLSNSTRGKDRNLVKDHHLNDRVVIYERTGKNVERIETLRLVMPDGSQFPDQARATARNSTIHLVHEGHWYTADIADLS